MIFYDILRFSSIFFAFLWFSWIFLRISVMEDEVEKTLWTGLTKWRKGSSYAPTDMQSAEMLVENLLVNL